MEILPNSSVTSVSSISIQQTTWYDELEVQTNHSSDYKENASGHTYLYSSVVNLAKKLLDPIWKIVQAVGLYTGESSNSNHVSKKEQTSRKYDEKALCKPNYSNDSTGCHNHIPHPQKGQKIGLLIRTFFSNNYVARIFSFSTVFMHQLICVIPLGFVSFTLIRHISRKSMTSTQAYMNVLLLSMVVLAPPVTDVTEEKSAEDHHIDRRSNNIDGKEDADSWDSPLQPLQYSSLAPQNLSIPMGITQLKPQILTDCKTQAIDQGSGMYYNQSVRKKSFQNRATCDARKAGANNLEGQEISNFDLQNGDPIHKNHPDAHAVEDACLHVIPVDCPKSLKPGINQNDVKTNAAVNYVLEDKKTSSHRSKYQKTGSNHSIRKLQKSTAGNTGHSQPSFKNFACNDVNLLSLSTACAALKSSFKEVRNGTTIREKPYWDGLCHTCNIVHEDDRYPCLKITDMHYVESDHLQFREDLKPASNNCAYILKEYSVKGIILNDVHFLSHFDKGGFGDVYKCKSNGVTFACKSIQRHKFHPNEAMIHHLSHGRFAPILYAVVFKYSHVFLLMEYMNKPEQFSSTKEMAYRLLEAVSLYKSEGLYHCDLKYSHIFRSEDGKQVKFVDWGSAWYRHEKWISKGYTYYYLSPERADQKKPPVNGDEYAVAICILRHVLGITPLTRMGIKPERVNIMGEISSRRMHDEVLDCIKEARKGGMISHEMEDLLYVLTAVNPKDRLTAEQALRRDIFREFRSKDSQLIREVHPNVARLPDLSETVMLTLMIKMKPQSGTFISSLPLATAVTEVLKTEMPQQLTDFNLHEVIQGKEVSISRTKLKEPIGHNLLIFCVRKERRQTQRTRSLSCGDCY